MSKLDELIKEYCPDGIQFNKLKDISVMQRGTSITKANSNSGDYPVVSGGKDPAFYCDIYNRDGETITVAGSGAGAGYVQYWTIPIFANDCFTIKGKQDIETKYLYYYLSSIQGKIYKTKKGGGVPHVHIADIESFRLPVPPLEVQREIVRVLDKFTLLTAELTAELTARKKQYEFYRNKMLTFETRIEKIPMGDLFDFRNGLSKGKEYFGKGIPFVRYTDVYNHRALRKDDITALVECTDKEKETLRVSRNGIKLRNIMRSYYRLLILTSLFFFSKVFQCQ